jgi:hypothetical protein
MVQADVIMQDVGDECHTGSGIVAPYGGAESRRECQESLYLSSLC